MIAFATTTITVLQPTGPQMDGEAYDDQPPTGYTEVATGVRAVIGLPRGLETVKGGEELASSLKFHCDPTAMDHYSWIRDETTGETYAVVWCMARNAFGVSFTHGQLRRVEGGV